MKALGDLAEPWVADAVEMMGAEVEMAAIDRDTAGVLIYTSGTTSSPKGALHGHGVLCGHLVGVSLSSDPWASLVIAFGHLRIGRGLAACLTF